RGAGDPRGDVPGRAHLSALLARLLGDSTNPIVRARRNGRGPAWCQRPVGRRLVVRLGGASRASLRISSQAEERRSTSRFRDSFSALSTRFSRSSLPTSSAVSDASMSMLLGPLELRRL